MLKREESAEVFLLNNESAAHEDGTVSSPQLSHSFVLYRAKVNLICKGSYIFKSPSVLVCILIESFGPFTATDAAFMSVLCVSLLWCIKYGADDFSVGFELHDLHRSFQDWEVI